MKLESDPYLQQSVNTDCSKDFSFEKQDWRMFTQFLFLKVSMIFLLFQNWFSPLWVFGFLCTIRRVIYPVLFQIQSFTEAISILLFLLEHRLYHFSWLESFMAIRTHRLFMVSLLFYLTGISCFKTSCLLTLPLSYDSNTPKVEDILLVTFRGVGEKVFLLTSICLQVFSFESLVIDISLKDSQDSLRSSETSVKCFLSGSFSDLLLPSRSPFSLTYTLILSCSSSNNEITSFIILFVFAEFISENRRIRAEEMKICWVCVFTLKVQRLCRGLIVEKQSRACRHRYLEVYKEFKSFRIGLTSISNSFVRLLQVRSTKQSQDLPLIILVILCLLG